MLSLENVPDPSTVSFLSESKYIDYAASFGTALNANIAVGEPPFTTPSSNADGKYGCYYGNISSSYDWGYYEGPNGIWPHNGGENLAFCDGHAEFRSRGEITAVDFGMTTAVTDPSYYKSLF
jgi:prepilin-type processing-associated H-X9-DG protein